MLYYLIDIKLTYSDRKHSSGDLGVEVESWVTYKETQETFGGGGHSHDCDDSFMGVYVY